jgi:glycosyltransferase involved in cell wall biosynthesis
MPAGAQRLSRKQRRQAPPISLSVFFPAYNDAATIGGLVEKTFAVLSELLRDFEVIVVNDGSRDGTAAVLAELETRLAPRFRVVTHPENRGYGAALRSGFAAATKDFVFYTDGDGQYDVGELPKLLAEVKPGVGLVNGYKLYRQDPLHRIWIGQVYNRFARLLFRVQLRDIDCDYRVIRRELLESFPLHSTSGTICVELVKNIELAQARVVEVPVHHYPRFHGRSQFFRWKALAVTFTQLLRLHYQVVVRPWFANLFQE